MDYVVDLTTEDLDQAERDLSAQASLTWDQICWANDAETKSKLIKELENLHQELQLVYDARVELYARLGK